MAYWELRGTSSIRQYLTEDAAKTIAVSLVLSPLEGYMITVSLRASLNVFYINSRKSKTRLPD